MAVTYDLRRYELRHLNASLVFDLVDVFARERGTRGPHPRPFGPLRFLVTARMVGLVRQEITPPVELVVKSNGGGYHLFFGQTWEPNPTIRRGVVSGESGRAVRRGVLADGRYVVRVLSDLYQTAERPDIDLPTPRTAFTFELRPGHFYPFPSNGTFGGGRGLTLLRGSIHSTAGVPAAGAVVEVVGVTQPYVTDESGQWVLVFPDTQPTGNISVRATLPDGAVVNVTGVAVERGRERSLSETALRGWVLTAAGAGLTGATVEVQGRPGGTTTQGDGSWFYYFGLTQPNAIVTVRATLPTGQTLAVPNVHVQARATVVVPPLRFP